MQILNVDEEPGGDEFLDGMARGAVGTVMALAGITAFLAGALSIVRGGERSRLVQVSAAVGLLISLVAVADLFIAH